MYVQLLARFSRHRFIGKPRVKGHPPENSGDHFWFLVHKTSLQEIVENIVLADRRSETDLSAKSSIRSTYFSGRVSENSVGQTIEHGRSTIIWFLGELFLTIYSAEFKNLSNTCGRYIIVSIKSCTKTLVSNRSNIRLPITDWG